ncbi:hypothetical protein TNCV_2060511 [Trichonephila clavipes]|nr:hypothetical protein TNCV_2060511 [Trichonephila clavipes]
MATHTSMFLEEALWLGRGHRDEFLEPYVRLFTGAVGLFFFNGSQREAHRAIVIIELLESEDIRLMDWPVRFETFILPWMFCGRQLQLVKPTPRTIQSLKSELLN